jgi:hypothetical protein
MRTGSITAFIAALVAVTAIPASGHHAVQKVFDVNKRIAVTGVVTSIEWANPHSYIALDAKGEKGDVRHWQFELAGALRNARAGVDDAGGLKAGDVVTIEGIAAKDGTPTGYAYTLRLAGRVVDLSNRQPPAR